MKIIGIEGMTLDQVQSEVGRGGRFVQYSYCFSVLVMTFRRPTDIYFVRPHESAVTKGLPWTLLTLTVGWWGFPWGLIYTPMALAQNLKGGNDLTPQVLYDLTQAQTAYSPPPPGPAPGTWPPAPGPQ